MKTIKCAFNFVFISFNVDDDSLVNNTVISSTDNDMIFFVYDSDVSDAQFKHDYNKFLQTFNHLKHTHHHIFAYKNTASCDIDQLISAARTELSTASANTHSYYTL